MKKMSKNHIKVMENMVGRKLLSDEVVHHIDGNHKNNNPSNLFLCKNSQIHHDCHFVMKKRIDMYMWIFYGT